MEISQKGLVLVLLSAKNFGCNSSLSKKSVNFTGIKTGNISHLSAIRKISTCHLSSLLDTLTEKVGNDFIQTASNGISTYKKNNAFLDTLKYPFTKMPLEILNSFAKRFNQDLYNGKLLTNFRNKGENEQYERALRGLLKNGDAFLDNSARKKNLSTSEIEKILCDDKCTKPFKEICDDVTDEFYKLFDKNFAPDAPKYNTTHERTVTRLVSGTMAALMLGTDFYNKSIQNGKSDTEAKEEAKGKRTQELLESGQEAVSQYFMLGAFSEFTNNSTFGAPILNTILGTIFRVTSRLSTGRPLTRIKPEEIKLAPVKIISMDGFLNSVQNKKPIELEEITPKLQTKKDDKKHILSAKNIALACLASIGAGFAIRGFKNTKAFENLLNLKPIKSISERFKKATIGQLWISENEFENFKYALKTIGRKDEIQYFVKKSNEIPLKIKNGKMFIGEYEKFTKIPHTNIQISKKELYTLPLAPLKIIKEIAFYPYKLVSAALEGLGVIKKIKPKEPENNYNIVNTFLDFQKQAEKFNNKIDSEEFIEHYAKHFENVRLGALNRETKSNVNNCDIGKLTALLGVFSSIYFSSTDDYNSTLKQTGDIDKANKDARLRGLNKIIRTSVQCAFLSLNNLFKIPYNTSLIASGIITAACTALTDTTSRILSGMPFVKMDKEGIEKYSKDKKDGLLKNYYEALDKLTD